MGLQREEGGDSDFIFCGDFGHRRCGQGRIRVKTWGEYFGKPLNKDEIRGTGEGELVGVKEWVRGLVERE